MILEQIVATLQKAESSRRAESDSLMKQALSSEGEKKTTLLRKSDEMKGYANGLSLAVLVIKNKQYEGEGNDTEHNRMPDSEE